VATVLLSLHREGRVVLCCLHAPGSVKMAQLSHCCWDNLACNVLAE